MGDDWSSLSSFVKIPLPGHHSTQALSMLDCGVCPPGLSGPALTFHHLTVHPRSVPPTDLKLLHQASFTFLHVDSHKSLLDCPHQGLFKILSCSAMTYALDVCGSLISVSVDCLQLAAFEEMPKAFEHSIND